MKKGHHEDQRDEINNYYTSLFAAIIAAIPFIEKVTSTIIDKQDSYLVKLSLIGLALIGLILASTWALSLTYTVAYLKSLEKLITNIEMKYDQPFFTFVLQDLKNNKASSRITKNQTVVPYTFIVIFLSIIIYSLLQFFPEFKV
ncbi:MAG: hypothetical protein LN567_06370 [Rickettsia endosymbiont of Graphium doson]|nr:hypothetical protein [Rickettsia endosymbiont of Graphium doson]